MKYQLKIEGKEKTKEKLSYWLLIIILMLLAFGTIMIASASYPYAMAHYGSGFYYITRHMIFLSVGIILMLVLSRVSIDIIKKASIYFYILCVVLLVAVLFGGFSEGVAKRWLGIPGTPLTFQPSELMKFGIILILSWYYSKEKKQSFLNEIILPGILLFLSCGLILLEKHLSGTVIVALIGLSIIFISGTSIKKMLFSYGTFAVASGTIFLLTNDYAMKRIESFFDPKADILSDKWQTIQGLYAIGSGGVFGLGIGNSRQKYSYVSEPQNDFIFTIWCEETGYIGGIFLILLFILLIKTGFDIGFNTKDKFSSLVALGITSQIAIQALLNMMVVTDLIPNTGISLPFFSYGGSSLVILLSEIGVLLSISRKSNRI